MKLEDTPGPSIMCELNKIKLEGETGTVAVYGSVGSLLLHRFR